MKLFLLLLLTFFNTFLFAQYDAVNKSANVIPYWNKGDVYEYEVIETKYDFKRYDTLNRKNSTYDLQLTVIDSTENSYILEWKSKFIIPEESSEVKAYIEKHYNELNNFKILYKTDEVGIVQEILNREELKKFYSKLIYLISQNIILGEKESKMITDLINNDEYFDTFLIQDLNQFHQFYGYQFTQTPIKNELEYINPITQTPIELKQTYKLNNYNVEDETYSIRMDQYVDEDKFLNDLKTNFLKDETQYDINIWVSIENVMHNSGVLLYSINTKVVDVDGTSKSVIKEIILKD